MICYHCGADEKASILAHKPEWVRGCFIIDNINVIYVFNDGRGHEEISMEVFQKMDNAGTIKHKQYNPYRVRRPHQNPQQYWHDDPSPRSSYEGNPGCLF
jgi:hypothetical protein